MYLRFVSIAWTSLALVQTANAQNPVVIPNGLIDRMQFTQLSEMEQRRYVTGVLEGLYISPFFGGNEREVKELQVCLVDRRVSDEQLRLTTAKLIGDEPERLGESAHVAVFNALRKICPKGE